MATLQKFKLLATQCAVAGSPSRSPTTSPVVHLRRRKTLRMLLNRTADRRRFPRRGTSRELQQIDDESSEMNEKEIRVRRKLKDLFVSSPPFEDKEKDDDDRQGFLPSTAVGFSSRRGGAGSLRAVSGTFRYRLLRRAWRPVLVTIPE